MKCSSDFVFGIELLIVEKFIKMKDNTKINKHTEGYHENNR